MPKAGEITLLLQQADEGDAHAANRLFLLVQKELKAIAGKRKNVAAGCDFSTTALVDEAYCKLVGQQVTAWRPGDRRKFFGYAALKMHDILVQEARARSAKKRGGNHVRLDAEEAGVEAIEYSPMQDEEALLDLKIALEKFEELSLDDAILFRIRFFLGCTFAETADIFSISPTEAKRRFEKTRLWLKRELKDYQHES